MRWTKDADQDLRRCWADESLSIGQIAKRFGCSRSATRRHAQRIGLERRDGEAVLSRRTEASRNHVWTPEAEARLLTLWADRAASIVAIARKLGTSRNSVSSKADRLGLPKRDGSVRAARKRRETPLAPAPSPPAPREISRAMRELAKFDPIVKRCVQMREVGL
jgi:hypothetical protein